MSKALKFISFVGLILTVAPSFFVLFGKVEFEMHKELMLTGTVFWMLTAPFWMNEKHIV